MDSWNEILKKANERLSKEGISGIKLVCAEGASTPYGDGYFDTIVCVNVLFNLPSEESFISMLDEMARICKPGGRVILDIRNGYNPILGIKYKLARYYDPTVRDLPLRTYKLNAVRRAMEERGFWIVGKTPIGFPNNILSPIFVLEARKA